jgi:hypothetical protein
MAACAAMTEKQFASACCEIGARFFASIVGHR